MQNAVLPLKLPFLFSVGTTNLTTTVKLFLLEAYELRARINDTVSKGLIEVQS